MKPATREWVRCAEEDFSGHLATRADARAALGVCRSVRADIRIGLGLPRK